MTHYSRLQMIVIDAPDADHDRELAFWGAATGKPLTQVENFPSFHFGQLHGQEAWLLLQRLGEGPARMHVDFHTDDLEAEVARLERLGAQRVEKIEKWWLMRDPAGLMFCVVPEPPGGLNDTNAQRWD
ncbi:MAG TPA: VOC family protein [Streptosporangiaceae bacterium]